MAATFVLIASGIPEHRQDTRVLRLGCVVDNTVTGANQTNNTPASAVNGGPITGLIPRDVGNGPLTVGDGGFDAPVPVCAP